MECVRHACGTSVRRRADTLHQATAASIEQASGDDLGLNFGSPFEDVQDTGIAEDAADLVFKGKTVAAVDLQGVVGLNSFIGLHRFGQFHFGLPKLGLDSPHLNFVGCEEYRCEVHCLARTAGENVA